MPLGQDLLDLNVPDASLSQVIDVQLIPFEPYDGRYRHSASHCILSRQSLH
jgi:hypothetical protein